MRVGEVIRGKKTEKGFKNPPAIKKVYDVKDEKDTKRLNALPQKGPPKRKKHIKVEMSKAHHHMKEHMR